MTFKTHCTNIHSCPPDSQTLLFPYRLHNIYWKLEMCFLEKLISGRFLLLLTHKWMCNILYCWIEPDSCFAYIQEKPHCYDNLSTIVLHRRGCGTQGGQVAEWKQPQHRTPAGISSPAHRRTWRFRTTKRLNISAVRQWWKHCNWQCFQQTWVLKFII